MFKKIVTTALAGAFALTMGCATQTSGPTVPGTEAGTYLSKLIGQNVLMDDPTLLQIYATTDCNVAAAQEFRASVLACQGSLAALVPGFAMPPQAVTGVQDACQVLGYTNAANQLLTSIPSTINVGPASVCTAPAASIKAPLGSKLILPIASE